MWCFGEKTNPAQQRYLRRGRAVMLSYVALLFSAVLLVNRFHPQGVPLYLVALLPSLPVFSLLFVMARYLREERDEYQRDLVIRCLLWGIAAMLAVELFTSFLHIFGWKGVLPAFTSFYSFCGSMIVAKFTYRFRNRLPASDDDQ